MDISIDLTLLTAHKNRSTMQLMIAQAQERLRVYPFARRQEILRSRSLWIEESVVGGVIIKINRMPTRRYKVYVKMLRRSRYNPEWDISDSVNTGCEASTLDLIMSSI